MARSRAVTARRATLLVTSRCNNACAFCAQSGVAHPDATDLDAALRSLAAAHDEVTLTGGEPTLRDDLADVVKAARDAGFRRVGLQTNGRRLREAGYATALARAGLTDVHLSLHGSSAAAHDYHTGAAGSFVESAAGFSAARAAGLTAVVSTVLTRSNHRALAELPPWLAARGTAAWVIHLPRAAGRAIAGFDRVMPRLAMALPSALHALASARNVSLMSWVRGAPLCLLGPYVNRALDDEPRAYGPMCEGCVARPRGPGVDPLYLRRFEGDELAAARAPRSPPPEPSARDAAIARMFTGPGELALAAPAPPHIADRRARVSLPLAQEG